MFQAIDSRSYHSSVCVCHAASHLVQFHTVGRVLRPFALFASVRREPKRRKGPISARAIEGCAHEVMLLSQAAVASLRRLDETTGCIALAQGIPDCEYAAQHQLPLIKMRRPTALRELSFSTPCAQRASHTSSTFLSSDCLCAVGTDRPRMAHGHSFLLLPSPTTPVVRLDGRTCTSCIAQS